MSPRTDAQLVAAFVEGDESAREELLARWLPQVLDWCVRIGGPKVDPEDACHDIFLVVLTRLDRLQERERFPAWLFGVTRRILDRHRRRAWVRRWVPGFVPDVRSSSAGPDRQIDRRRVGDTILHLLDGLPALQREAVVLADVEGRPLPDVAEMLGVPLGTVKSRLRLARERLRADPACVRLLPFLEGEVE